MNNIIESKRDKTFHWILKIDLRSLCKKYFLRIHDHFGNATYWHCEDIVELPQQCHCRHRLSLFLYAYSNFVLHFEDARFLVLFSDAPSVQYGCLAEIQFAVHQFHRFHRYLSKRMIPQCVLSLPKAHSFCYGVAFQQIWLLCHMNLRQPKMMNQNYWKKVKMNLNGIQVIELCRKSLP